MNYLRRLLSFSIYSHIQNARADFLFSVVRWALPFLIVYDWFCYVSKKKIPKKI